MTLKMNEDGSLDLNASIHEVGAGSTIMIKTILAEELDVAPEMISAGEAYSGTSPYDFGCFGSRMTYVCGAGARVLAQRLKQRLVEAAAELLEVSVNKLEGAGGRVQIIGADGIGLSFAQIVRDWRTRYAGDVIVTNTYRGTSNPGAYSVQFAEVEVDAMTGLTRVSEFLTVIDIGRAINRDMVEGQCRGAVQAGIGSALCEEVTIDAYGITPIGGFKNYHLVNSVDMPPVRVLLVEHDGDDGPYGAKSVGEVAVVPTAAAIVNAVNRALGTAIATLPLTPESIVAALADASIGERIAS